jgi:hypothetical protein
VLDELLASRQFRWIALEAACTRPERQNCQNRRRNWCGRTALDQGSAAEVYGVRGTVDVSDIRPSLNRPIADYRGIVDYVNLDGDYEAFDLSDSVGVKPSGDEDVWYGQDRAGRGDEVLYRTAEGRWVLVFVVLPGCLDPRGPHPLERELTPTQASRWLRINALRLPVGLRPSSLNDDAERRIGQARLDRDWTPPGRLGNDPVDQERPSTARAESSQSKNDEPETEATVSPPEPAVILNGPDQNPIVLGKEKKRLSPARYDVVKALLDANRNLTKDELDRKSKHSDARKLLGRLADSDPDWKAVIVFPAAHGAGYGIRRP